MAPAVNPNSGRLFAEASALIPGGVNSPVRAFGAVGGTPRFIERGSGPRLLDADGHSYIDYVLSWGALPLGHADPEVVAAIGEQAARGTSFGAPTALETELARRITEAMPAIEMVRFVSSGTEAVMSAVRLARAVTGRARIVKFAGCYHGHADAMLVQAGSGAATLGLPDSPGVTGGSASDTLIAEYNDLASVERLADRHGGEIAAVIVEPVAGNMGLVLPQNGFLSGLRDLCDRIGALLVFDEVMSGFRVAYGGAQSVYGVTPDLTCLGKIIGGGLPAAAYGGRRDLLRRVAPSGDVYQAGTLSGNPLAMIAGCVTLDRLRAAGTYDRLGQLSGCLAAAVGAAGARAGVPVEVASVGGMWGFFFAAAPVARYADAAAADAGRYARFFHAMLERGVYLAPSQFEAAFVSTAHGDDEITETISAVEGAMGVVSAAG